MFEEMTRRDELLMMISDQYKSVNGYRPRGLYLDKTESELEQIFEELQVEVELSIEADKQMQSAYSADFEQKISDLIATGANDRETAIRWFRDSFDDEYMAFDDSYFECIMGLPFGYMKKAA